MVRRRKSLVKGVPGGKLVKFSRSKFKLWFSFVTWMVKLLRRKLIVLNCSEITSDQRFLKPILKEFTVETASDAIN